MQVVIWCAGQSRVWASLPKREQGPLHRTCAELQSYKSAGLKPLICWPCTSPMSVPIVVRLLSLPQHSLSLVGCQGCCKLSFPFLPQHVKASGSISFFQTHTPPVTMEVYNLSSTPAVKLWCCVFSACCCDQIAQMLPFTQVPYGRG